VAAPKVECLWPVEAELGEGPVWSAGEGAVWFVDIKGRHIHRFDPATGERRSWDAPSNPGFLAPLRGGGWLAGLKSGLHRFDPASGGFELLSLVEPAEPDNRLNDGCVDRSGRLWFGSMHDLETDPTGALYRLDPDGTLQAHDDGYVITNGPAFSPDGRTAYHTDTLERTIYAFDVGEDGALSRKRVFARIDRGYPDGPAVDAEGCVWTALFAGWGLNRYAPDGTLMEHVTFPVANVTKPAFGGEDLRTVYCTTAWKGLSAAERSAQPLAGGLFAFRADTPGLPQREVRLDR
jgi:sugar lactone lactonase YvrE